MKNKPKILITNDDGVHAVGIRCLWKELKDLGATVVVAPEREHSGAGASVSFAKPLEIERLENWDEEASYVWSVSGTPVDCVRMGLNLLKDQLPDIVVSGVNKGSNAGRNVLYSGTVGGAAEAALRGIPAVAFSCESFETPNYARAAHYISSIVNYVLAHPLPPGTLLNVNFPCNAPEIKGVRLAKQGMGYWRELWEHHGEVDGRSRYHIDLAHADFDEDEESDIHLLRQGYVAAVPVHVDRLTDEEALHSRKEHFCKYIN